MLRGVLVDEPPVAGHVREKHPAGAAVKRVAHRPELGAPALERAEIAGQDLGHARGRLPVAAEAREVQLGSSVELSATSSSRLRPLRTCAGVLAKSSDSSCSVIAFS